MWVRDFLQPGEPRPGRVPVVDAGAERESSVGSTSRRTPGVDSG